MMKKEYLRPIYVSIALCVFAEALIFVVFGLLLFPSGNILYKALWTLVFCGVGMGLTAGVAINVFVVNKIENFTKATTVIVLLYVLLLGVACNLLCLKLDLEFGFFGTHTNPVLFFINGIVQSAIGGLIAAVLLLSEKGKRYLAMAGL